MEDNEEDTHLCLRCSATISGLKNYIAHRKHNCSKTARYNNAIAPVASPIPEQHYEPSALRADDFFSSLELQSIQAVVPSDAHGSSAANKSSQADDDLEEAEDSDSDLYPPTSHTGGKWKPGCRPDGRSQWKTTLFPAEHPYESRESSSTIKEFLCVPCKRLYRSKSQFSRHQQTSYHLKRAGGAPASQVRASERLVSSLFAANHSKIAARSYVQGTKMKTHKNTKKSDEALTFSCLTCNENSLVREHLKDGAKAKDSQNKTLSRTKQQCHVCGYRCHGSSTLNFHMCKPKQHDGKYTGIPLSGAQPANNSGANMKDSACTNSAKEKEPQIQNTACKINSSPNMEQDLNENQCGDSGSGLNYKASEILVQSETVVSGKESTKGTCNGVTRLPCPYCQQLVSKSYFKLHVNKHTGAKPFSCRLCGRTFAHRSTLSTHMKHHQGIRKFQCPQCDFRAVRGSMLRRHELAVHQPTQSAQTYSCDACSTKHSSRESLRRHSARHSAEYACSVADCGRTFQDASGLKQHSLTHNGTPPYLCEACGHMTKSAHHLVKHQRRHNGERPFKCPHCDYRASRNSQLHRHSRIHTGLKPYSCPYCSYQCNNQENIRKHILKTKKHVGKKMYPCSHCNFSCNDFIGYRDHIRQNHRQDCNGEDVSDPLVGAKDTATREQSGSFNLEIGDGGCDAQGPRETAVAKSPALPEPAVFLTISGLNEPGSDTRSATASRIALLTEKTSLPGGSGELVTCAENDLTDTTEGILLPGGLDGDLNDQLSEQVNFSGLDSQDMVYVLAESEQ